MSPAPTPDASLSGTNLQQGKYRLDRVLSQSESLITYYATHRCLDKAVAIQTLRHRPERYPNQPRIVQQFIATAQKASKPSHPHLVHVNDLFVESGLPFLVTDYLVGDSLQKLAAQQPLSEGQAVGYILQIAPALSTLHQRNYLHGDLQPEHLLLQLPARRVILTDLGIEQSLMPHSLNSKATGYIAPEQYSPHLSLSPASDVYALAAILYTLLTGHRPVSAKLRQQKTSLPSPRQFCPQMSVAIEQAILAGMALRIAERPQSIEQWLARLRSMSPSEPPRGQGPTAPATQLQKATQLQVAPIAVPSVFLKSHTQRSNLAAAETEIVAASPPPVSPSTPHSDMSTRSKPPTHPKFPIRFLWLTSAVAGVLGLGFGFVVRFNYFSQFPAPQAVNPKSTKVQRESFPPRPQTDTSDFDSANNSVDTTPVPDRGSQDFANVEQPVTEDRITGREDRQTLRSSQPTPSDSIVESEIGEIPHELTPAGLTIPQEDSSSPTLSDWADIIPSQSAYQTTPSGTEDAELPVDATPIPDEFEQSDVPDQELLTPQI